MPGGGAEYCAGCPEPCAECPYTVERPQTWEGWQVWHLATQLGGQVRAMPGAVLGFDMTAALAMARAGGVDEAVAADFLPVIEAAMVRRINEKAGDR